MPRRTANLAIAMLAAVAAVAPATRCFAVKISDITRIGGERTNVLTGLGLVCGLKGTGDGGAFAPAIKPLASMLAKFADPSTAAELTNASNVAIVNVVATVPKDGARNGDAIDVFVTSWGDATSLKNGRLFVTPLMGPLGGPATDPVTGQPIPFALAQGGVILEDPSTPTAGKVQSGAVMEVDMMQQYVDGGRFSLVIDDPSASWTTSSVIAKIINDAESTSGELLAVAVDPKSVVVTLPESERDRPDAFISRVQRLPLPSLPSEARVQINDRTGTLIITGDVEISPVVISHKGLTISTIAPELPATAANPKVTTKTAIGLDTTSTGGAKLQDLVDMLDRIKVPAEDRITIVKELFKTGKLHAKLVVEQ